MEVPVSQFRRDLFTLMNRALEGEELWVTHKGRRLRILPDGKSVDKLSRITPMDILVSGTDLEDDSWRQDMMREWERKWDRRLAPLAKPTPSTAKHAPKASQPTRTRKARLQA